MKKPYLAPEALVEALSVEQCVLTGSGENINVAIYTDDLGGSSKAFWE